MGPRIQDLETRIQDLPPEPQDPQNKTNDLELMIEDLRPKSQTSDIVGPDVSDHTMLYGFLWLS